MDIFSSRLKDLREEKGLTQSDLVQLLKSSQNITTSTQNISYWEKGREPNYSTLCSLAKCFNVTTDYLLGNSNLRNSSDFSTIKELELILNTNDKLFALHTILTNIKCFSSLFEYGAKISHSETIFLCKIILENMISTISTFQEKNDKFSPLNHLLQSEEQSDSELQKLLYKFNNEFPIVKDKKYTNPQTIEEAKTNLGTLINFRNKYSSYQPDEVDVLNQQITYLKNLILDLEKKGSQ